MSRLARRRRALFDADPHCRWCGCLTVWWDEPGAGPDNAATIDHLRSRLNPRRGRAGGGPKTVLACRSCNQLRAADEDLALPLEERRRRSGRMPSNANDSGASA